MIHQVLSHYTTFGCCLHEEDPRLDTLPFKQAFSTNEFKDQMELKRSLKKKRAKSNKISIKESRNKRDEEQNGQKVEMRWISADKAESKKQNKTNADQTQKKRNQNWTQNKIKFTKIASKTRNDLFMNNNNQVTSKNNIRTNYNSFQLQNLNNSSGKVEIISIKNYESPEQQLAYNSFKNGVYSLQLKAKTEQTVGHFRESAPVSKILSNTSESNQWLQKKKRVNQTPFSIGSLQELNKTIVSIEGQQQSQFSFLKKEPQMQEKGKHRIKASKIKEQKKRRVQMQSLKCSIKIQNL